MLPRRWDEWRSLKPRHQSFDVIVDGVGELELMRGEHRFAMRLDGRAHVIQRIPVLIGRRFRQHVIDRFLSVGNAVRLARMNQRAQRGGTFVDVFHGESMRWGGGIFQPTRARTHKFVGGGALNASTSIDHPAVDRLVEVEWTWNGHVRLDVLEACLLKGAVRSCIERMRLAEQLLQPESLKVEFDGLSDAFNANSLLTKRGIRNVKVHICVLTDVDLVGGREA